MEKRRVTAMKVRRNTYGKIMECGGGSMASDAVFRSMLVSLKPGCYVETVDGDGGDVVEVERDRYDIPTKVKTVVKVVDEKTREVVDEFFQWIDVHRIFFFEPWDFIAPVYLFEDENAAIGEFMFASEVT